MTATPLSHDQAVALARQLLDQLDRVVVGQTPILRQVLAALLADGHVLLEGLPGLGKTLLARALASSLTLHTQRIQFTPDLMPADVTGHAMYDPAEQKFRIRRGPAFTQLLLADEINRAPPKTQSALLEVMQERQITLEGRAMPLELPFMVIATQNPLEQEGTYPLPEAELDRFMLKVLIDYPSEDFEIEMLHQILDGTLSSHNAVSQLQAVADGAQVLALQAHVRSLHLDPELVRYIVTLVRESRVLPTLRNGASPRACIALARTAAAHALLEGRDHVTPDDIQQMAAPVLRHRLVLNAEAEIEGLSVDTVIQQLLQRVPVPRQ